MLEELEDFNSWKSTAPDPSRFTLFDYIGCVATPDLFFGFAEVFSPSLLLHEGSYFIESRFSLDNYATWKSRLHLDSEIQKMMNHLHIRSIFQGSDMSDRNAVEAAKTIATFWTLVFKDKGLVGVASGDDFDTAEVTLYRP